MKHGAVRPLLAAGLILVVCPSSSAAAVDEDAAKALFKRNNCVKCHAADKVKRGPALKKMSANYGDKKAEGEAKMIKAMSTLHRVKLDDGTEEDHKVIDTRDEAEIRNIARWILIH